MMTFHHLKDAPTRYIMRIIRGMTKVIHQEPSRVVEDVAPHLEAGWAPHR